MDTQSLVSQLREFGLWPESEPLQANVLQLSRQASDGRQLAREMIQRDLLTPYQANQLLTGKGRSLVLGPYRIVERLGEGGVGQVFKARHQVMRRLVALKIIRPEHVSNPESVGRFFREVQSIARLSHPNIVRIYDAEQDGSTYYYVMQFAHGTDLSRLVKKGGPLSIDQACDYVRQAALGLQHIFEHGLVHRDMKPSNLLVTGEPDTGSNADVTPSASVAPDGTVKVLDLGLARLTEIPKQGLSMDGPLTQEGVVMGTADYMAPEQARDSRLVDIRSDIYGLGCTFYFLLTGQPPFSGGSAVEKILSHQLDEPTPLETLRPDVTPNLAAVVRRMMAKNPAQRFQTPAEVAVALTGSWACASSSSANLPKQSPQSLCATQPDIATSDTDLNPLIIVPSYARRRSGTGRVSPWMLLLAAALGLGLGMLLLLLFPS
jgi:serine/threonine-protein kinase